MTETTIATMNATELKAHIKGLEEGHRHHMRALKALMRAREAEEALRDMDRFRQERKGDS